MNWLLPGSCCARKQNGASGIRSSGLVPGAERLRWQELPRFSADAEMIRRWRKDISEFESYMPSQAVGSLPTNRMSLKTARHLSNPRLWPRADDLLDHIRLLARERGQPFDVIESAAREQSASMRKKKGSREARMQDIPTDTESRAPSSRVLQEVIRQAPAEYVVAREEFGGN